jgi:hypothetical protein
MSVPRSDRSQDVPQCHSMVLFVVTEISGRNKTSLGIQFVWNFAHERFLDKAHERFLDKAERRKGAPSKHF